MAEKQDYLQSELFTQSQNSGQYKPRTYGNQFFTRIRGYEKILLLIMGLVLLSVISFSLGVEKGKRVVLTSNNNIEPASYTIQVGAFKNRNLALHQAQLLAKKGLAPLAFAKGNYIILCVGKFSNQERAQPLLTQLQKTYAGCRIRRL
ncbi:MAG: SPOR domain-containing protein [Candidatus Omnitrophica bacterium]|nr:SPOR domain-containing protein [Candidatus Omnitrophota bacterium]MBU1923434.1 SPOR domain-containing protein [Candidatus Omnitrophota bacterium]